MTVHFTETPAQMAARLYSHNGDDTKPNEARAARAFLAVMPEYSEGSARMAVIDLLVDLRHLCDMAGLPFDHLKHQADTGYRHDKKSFGPAENAAFQRAIVEHMT